MTATLRRAGAGLFVLYAATAVATHVLAGGAGRPLFDGFGPPAPYRWVNPPPELARDNMPAESAERLVPLTDMGSEPTNASTPDAQIIVGLPRTAIPPHPPDTAVLLRIAPRDGFQLGPIPPDLRVVSNAYQITMAYQPSQEPITQVVLTASIAMTASTQGDTLLYSTDGQQWAITLSRPFGATHGVLGTFEGPGYYLVAASPAVTATTTTRPSAEGGGSGGFLAAMIVAAAIGLIGLAVVTVQRRRRAAAAAARARARRTTRK